MTEKQQTRQLKNDVRNFLKYYGKSDDKSVTELAYITADAKLKDPKATEKQRERWAAIKAQLV